MPKKFFCKKKIFDEKNFCQKKVLAEKKFSTKKKFAKKKRVRGIRVRVSRVGGPKGQGSSVK